MRRVLLVVALLGSLAAGWLWAMLLRPGPQREVDLEVAEGAATVAVLEQLHSADLLPSVNAARIYLALFGRGRSPRFGSYRVPPSSRPVEVLERILDGRVKTLRVTIIEGLTADAVAERCVAAGIGDPEQWQQVIQGTEWISDLAPAAANLEGFLFPETYRFSAGISAGRAARHMVLRFRRVWQEETTMAPDAWGTPLQVVTLASLVEAETSLDDERARIAGVFLNRLDLGMLLQCDPTVVFGLKQLNRWDGRLLRQHWQLDHPYNTYRYPGLPPGPINSPGRAAIRAALQPERTRDLYFVAKPGGGHTFSKTLKEHNRAVARLRRSRR